MFDCEVEVASRLALEAGAALRRHQAGPVEIQRKAHGEVVTVADLEADAIIQTGLQAAFPEDAIYSEETADTPARLSSPRVWIVDPLDSTSDFTERGDEYSVSIGLALEGRPVLGAVYNPARDELFAGSEESGITLNTFPARVSEVPDLDRARLIVSRREWNRGLNKLAVALPIRPMASIAYKLARVAAGLDDGMFSAVPRKQWDTCAGVALILAAGGRATLLDGEPIVFNRSSLRQPLGMVAAGPKIHPVLLETLHRLFTSSPPPDRSAHE